MKTLSKTLEEFDKKFCRKNKDPERLGEIMDRWFFPDEITPFEVKSFISSSFCNLLKQVLPKPKKFPKIESDDFDEGYEFCRQEVENRIKEILK